MAFTPKTWTNHAGSIETAPTSAKGAADDMNRIEEGIADAHEAITALQEQVPRIDALETTVEGLQVVSLDENGDIPESALPPSIEERLTALEAGGGGGGGGGTSLTPMWAFGKGSAGDQTLVANTPGEWFPLHDTAVLEHIALQLDAAGGTDTQVTLEHRPFGSGTITDLYAGATPATVLAGSVARFNPTLPTTTALEPGQIRPRLKTVPAGPSGSASPMERVDDEPYTSGTATKNSHDLLMPTGGTAGDLLVALESLQAPTPDPSTAWSLRRSQISDVTTVRSRLALHTSAWASDRSMVFPLLPAGAITSSPMDALTLILRNADLSNPIVESDSNTNGNAGGGSLSTPSKAAAAAASDLTLYFATWWLGNGSEGHKLTAATVAALTSAGITTLHNDVTTRTAATNVGLWVGVGPGFAAGAAIPSRALTIGEGTAGAVGAASMNSGYATFRRGAATAGPVRLTVVLNLAAQAA